MLPVLLPSFGCLVSIFLCPLFFGLAHFHHIYESIKEGNKLIFAFYRSGDYLKVLLVPVIECISFWIHIYIYIFFVCCIIIMMSWWKGCICILALSKYEFVLINQFCFCCLGFQFMYTTIFGIYSAFLFIRTGNFNILIFQKFNLNFFFNSFRQYITLHNCTYVLQSYGFPWY